MKKSNAETMQINKSFKVSFPGGKLPLKRIHYVKNFNRQRLETTWKYQPQAQDKEWTPLTKPEDVRVLFWESEFDEDTSCFSDTLR